MRNAELKGEVVRVSTLALTFRIPHSVPRITGRGRGRDEGRPHGRHHRPPERRQVDVVQPPRRPPGSDRGRAPGGDAGSSLRGGGLERAAGLAVGKSSGDLLDRVVEVLSTPDLRPGSVTDPGREPGVHGGEVDAAVVGRPNVGKSSLVNRLLDSERLVVADEPGTTRDAIDTPLRYEGRTLVFIDTAGLRKRSKVDDDIEFYATLRTARAIERADVCVLVVDAQDGMHVQDLKIANDAWERGAALIIAVNKWDLIEEKDTNTAVRGEREIKARAPFLEFIPFLYVSAKTGQRTTKLLELILAVAAERDKRIPTHEVNEVLEALVDRQQPPQPVGEAVRLLDASQIGTAPPRFAIVSNRPGAVPEAYTRYLLNGFRAAWQFTGSPVAIKFRRRREQAAHR